MLKRVQLLNVFFFRPIGNSVNRLSANRLSGKVGVTNQSLVLLKEFFRNVICIPMNKQFFHNAKLIFCSTSTLSSFNYLFAKFTGFVVNFWPKLLDFMFLCCSRTNLHNNNVSIWARRVCHYFRVDLSICPLAVCRCS